MRHAVWALVCVLASAGAVFHAHAGEKLELADGEAVAFLGNAFFELDVPHGFIETALTLAYKDKNLTFRNLGWSGDTVWGHARAGFGSVQDGYNKLIKDTLTAKPTTILLCYGMSESFDGESGIAPFIAQYNKLLDDLSPANAKIVIVTPIKHEKLANPALPDPAPHNAKTEKYVAALAKLAEARKAFFVDLFHARFGTTPEPLTLNGIHPSPNGLKHYGACIAGALAGTIKTVVVAPQIIALDCEEATIQAGSRVAVEKLQETIVEKNTLFFNRWRPQNETYIYGFRKHEQGRNAALIPQFDPLIAAKEKEIAELKKSIN
jgi:lysophospholipase L1-like esterase